MNDRLLMRVLHAFTDVHEKFQPFAGGQIVIVAISRNGNADHILHHKVRSALRCRVGVEHLGDGRMVHQGQCLALGVEARNRLAGIHPAFDQLKSNPAADRLFLLRQPDLTHAPFSDPPQQGIPPDHDHRGFTRLDCLGRTQTNIICGCSRKVFFRRHLGKGGISETTVEARTSPNYIPNGMSGAGQANDDKQVDLSSAKLIDDRSRERDCSRSPPRTRPSAPLRIRFSSQMCSGETAIGKGMERTGFGKPSLRQGKSAPPGDRTSLTSTPQSELPEPRDSRRNGKHLQNGNHVGLGLRLGSTQSNSARIVVVLLWQYQWVNVGYRHAKLTSDKWNLVFLSNVVSFSIKLTFSGVFGLVIVRVYRRLFSIHEIRGVEWYGNRLKLDRGLCEHEAVGEVVGGSICVAEGG